MPDLFSLLRGTRFCHALFTTVLVYLDHVSLLMMWTPRNLKLSTCSTAAYHRCVIGKLNDGVGVVPGRAVMSEQGVQEGSEHAPLKGPCGEDQCGGHVVTYPYHLGLAHQEVQDPDAEGGV
jgi:hypothetical protein